MSHLYKSHQHPTAIAAMVRDNAFSQAPAHKHTEQFGFIASQTRERLSLDRRPREHADVGISFCSCRPALSRIRPYTCYGVRKMFP